MRKREAWAGKVAFTTEFNRWFKTLNASERQRMQVNIDELAAKGPKIQGAISKRLLKNGKGLSELRTGRPPLRALYLFDRHRNAVLLCGGDKSGEWTDWYDDEIARAWRIYDAYLAAQSRQSRQPGART